MLCAILSNLTNQSELRLSGNLLLFVCQENMQSCHHHQSARFAVIYQRCLPLRDERIGGRIPLQQLAVGRVCPSSLPRACCRTAHKPPCCFFSWPSARSATSSKLFAAAPHFVW